VQRLREGELPEYEFPLGYVVRDRAKGVDQNWPAVNRHERASLCSAIIQRDAPAASIGLRLEVVYVELPSGIVDESIPRPHDRALSRSARTTTVTVTNVLRGPDERCMTRARLDARLRRRGKYGIVLVEDG
jgi:hypothetical protein